jgi:tetratricopeptide (TPR) repeat protein
VAIEQYQEVIEFLSDLPLGIKELEQVQLACHLNLSLAHGQLRQHLQVLEHADAALHFDPKSTKALYRRGEAYLALQKYEKAKEDFHRVISLDPSNNSAKKSLQHCKKIIMKK